MTTHLYAFGSICRGEIDHGSDIDLLACVAQPQPEIDPKKFSIYSYDRIRELWDEGNPFAWHLHYESKLLFSSDGTNFLSGLGGPSHYDNAVKDCSKFHRLFIESYNALQTVENSKVFHLSCMFLATRNFATCYSFTVGRPIFSRRSPLLIDRSLRIGEDAFDVLARARILSTRGYGDLLSVNDIDIAMQSAPIILDWMKELMPSGETT